MEGLFVSYDDFINEFINDRVVSIERVGGYGDNPALDAVFQFHLRNGSFHRFVAGYNAQGEILPPIANETTLTGPAPRKTYAVITSNTGDGRISVQAITGDQAMREYCLGELAKYSATDSSSYENLPLDQLIKLTIRMGSAAVHRNIGSTVQSVLLGDNIVEFKP